MPNISIYVPDSVADDLKRWPAINKSRIATDALKREIHRRDIEARAERGEPAAQ